MTALTILDLTSNRLHSLGQGIFASLEQLDRLHLANNLLPDLEALSTMSHSAPLTELVAHSNRITAIGPSFLPPGVRDSILAIYLSNNALTAVPSGPFSNMRKLRGLTLSANRITSIESGAFAGLSSLWQLDLLDNSLQSLAPDLLSPLTGLRELDISDNHLCSLPGSLLQNAPGLMTVRFSQNCITQLPSTLFAHQSQLQQLKLSQTCLTSLQAGVFASLSSLTLLQLEHAQLQSVAPGAFQGLTSLLYLHIYNNFISHLPDDVFRGLENIELLDASFNRLTTLSAAPFRHLSTLKRLDIAGNMIPSLPENALRQLPNLEQLYAQSNALRTVTLTHQHRLTVIDVSRNRVVNMAIVSDVDMNFIDASNNAELQHLNVTGSVASLDVSGTGIALDNLPCTRLGKKQLMAQRMLHPSWVLASTLDKCLKTPDRRFLEVSGEMGGQDIEAVRLAVARTFALVEVISLDNQVFAEDNEPVLVLPQLEISSSVVECAVARSNALVFNVDTRQLSYIPSASYACGCVPGYLMRSSRCVRKEPWVALPGHLALVIFASLGLGAGLVWLARRMRKRFRGIRADLDLHQRLLENAEGEVEALKRAWEIDASEVQLGKRIDVDSPGAFGAVYRADWDGMAVAVKVLQAGLLAMDAGSAAEFEKEADFMMRARHANLVRFFGVGRMAGGEPFVVLELVTRGSLRALLNGSRRPSMSAKVMASFRERTRLASASTAAKQSLLHRSAASKLTPAVRQGMASDVARGMAYIHSLGHFHRDLKSGNVLVTENWRAKVADFGSISGILMRSAAHQSADARRSNHRHSMLDLDAAARSETSSRTQTVQVGTPLYMPPEVLRGRPFTEAADVWCVSIWRARGGPF
jgi:Leucine-rich repeat (LRR) protein